MEFKLPQISGEDVARMIRTSQNANSNTPIVAVTGYIKELMQPHYFDSLIEKPMTSSRLIEVLETFCMWKPPLGERPIGERRDSFSLSQSPQSISQSPQSCIAKKPEDDKVGRVSPSVEKFMATTKRGSSLGQMSSYTEDEGVQTGAPTTRKSPLSIPRSTKAEWGIRNTPEMKPAMRKPTPGHLTPPISITHQLPITPSSRPVPARLNSESSLHQISLPKIPAIAPLPPPITSLTPPTSSPERKSKRSSLEKKVSRDADGGDADDEKSRKKPSKSRSISDFAAKIKRVSTEMKRSKSNISE